MLGDLNPITIDNFVYHFNNARFNDGTVIGLLKLSVGLQLFRLLFSQMGFNLCFFAIATF